MRIATTGFDIISPTISRRPAGTRMLRPFLFSQIALTLLLAQQSDINHTMVMQKSGAELYMACAPCHGLKGEKTAFGQSEAIGQWDAASIVKALKAYREGKRDKAGYGKTMNGQIKAYSDQDIELLAEHITSFSANQHP
jgi:cytochrome c553